MRGLKSRLSATSESAHEILFLQYWMMFKAEDDPDPVAQYRFDSVRRWRLDFAWVDQRVGVEIDGAIWTRGAHATGRGTERDREKSNALMLKGWALLRYSTNTLESNPHRVVREIQQLLRLRS